LVQATAPVVLLLDLSLPGVGGIEATRRVRAEHPELPVLILTSSRDEEQLREALAAGATGYVVKDAEPAEIAAAVRAAARGGAPIDPRMTRSLFPAGAPVPAATAAAERAADPARVRGREAEVLRLLAQGLANKQIARELGISERTVKVHVGSVFRRLGVNDRVSAALWARENGLG
ncbi:MAG: response regulator transcription factor, partial [Herbiconiux sp.]|nr:response regulator transcription factor [Herbiconiux sp.]